MNSLSDDKRMNVYLTTSRKDLKNAYVAILSLFENNVDSEIFLYIVSEDLTNEDIKFEEKIAEKYNNHIIILRLDVEEVNKAVSINNGKHWSIGAMSVYWLFHRLLPSNVTKIIAIESDTVIIGSLADIYSIDLDGYYMASAGPEHKPANHREFMKKIGGECVTFVSSVYNVSKIKEDFSLSQILEMDKNIQNKIGSSQMEFTFGILFKNHIKYFPGVTSCLDENERYAEELGYNYIISCEKTVKILHFSSYGDYSKPWNPVRIMPGYIIWWKYAIRSPYYDDLFFQQWEIYDQNKAEEEKKIKRINSIKNCLSLFVLVDLILINLFFLFTPNVSASISVGLLSIIAIALVLIIRIVYIKVYSNLYSKWRKRR